MRSADGLRFKAACIIPIHQAISGCVLLLLDQGARQGLLPKLRSPKRMNSKPFHAYGESIDESQAFYEEFGRNFAWRLKWLKIILRDNAEPPWPPCKPQIQPIHVMTIID